jgi:tetratricopeptide (TPR) repeat protein
MPRGNCEFRGTGGQYFVTVFVHLFLLSIVTCGLYSSWAWVRLFKLKASHTSVNGKQATFTGTGGQLFILVLVNGLLTLVTFGIYGPWAICRFFHWKTEHTLVAERSSRFTGTGGGLFFFYLIQLLILPLLTLGLYYFWGIYRLYAWKEEHSKYGGEKTSFGAGFAGFLSISVIGWALNVITLSLFLPWSLCMLYRWQIHGLAVGDSEGVSHFPPVKTNVLAVALIVIIGLFLFFGLGLEIKNQLESHLKESIQQPRITKIKKIHPKANRPLKTGTKGAPTPATPPAAKKKAIIDQAGKKGEAPDRKAETDDLEIKRLDGLIDKDSGFAHAYYNRAWIYAAKGDLKKGIEDYTRAVKADNKYGDAYYNRGLLYVKMKRYDAAVEDFSRSLKLDPNAFDAYCNRGNVYFQLGKTDLAIKDYNAGLKIGPEDPDLHHNRGVVYLSMGKEKKAEKDFNKAESLRTKEAKNRH